VSESDPAGGNFHVDKRIPVAMIVTMLVQTAGVVWWAATLQAAQAQALVDGRRIELRVDRFELQRDDLSARVIRIEEKLEGQTDTLQQILRSVESSRPVPAR
jgi:MoxR-like ATPase